MPGDFIQRRGEIGREMYFISEGQVVEIETIEDH